VSCAFLRAASLFHLLPIKVKEALKRVMKSKKALNETIVENTRKTHTM
jgi:hypothetical protein